MDTPRQGVGGMSGSANTSSDRALQAALAEFTVIRSLMSMRFQTQIAVLSAGLTAIGVVAGLALQHGGDRRLLLLIPILASVVATINTELRIRIDLHGRYVNEKLWPYVARLTEDELPSWEVYWGDEAPRALMAVAGAQPSGFFVMASIITLAATAGSLGHDAAYVAIWATGVVMTGVSAVYTAIDVARLLGRIDRPTAQKEAEANAQAALPADPSSAQAQA
ncbi:MAG TPA: hypothetical protein VK778_13915 [Solirubrobacteraceae bacterium]|jgi:hypothetical protein|nr:hypothetical protein [Solirubrobacteraceae bacterium]